MKTIPPFRRRRCWNRPRDYGARPGKLRFWPEDDPNRVTLRGVAGETVTWLRRLRPFILGAIALTVWPAVDARLVDPPQWASTAPETVDQRFTRCGRGRGFACVIDGDTFKLGERKIRIIGIDTPEIVARCPAEARLAEQATAQLQASLNAGPFAMHGWRHNRRDRYGRELMALNRIEPGASDPSIAEELRRSGVARRYDGGLRGGWC